MTTSLSASAAVLSAEDQHRHDAATSAAENTEVESPEPIAWSSPRSPWSPS